MSPRGKGKSVVAPQEPSAAQAAKPAAAAAVADGQKDARRRRRRGVARSKSGSVIVFPTRRCLTARSPISALKGSRNRAGGYQRLEFLGDHVLGLVISDMLFRAFPRADEGELSRRLADLVRKETCADIARAINLGAAIRLGSSEANAGGRAPAGDPGRRLRSADRRGLSGRRLCGGRSAGRAAMGSAHAHHGAAAARSENPCCRNGRRRAACRRPPTAKSPVPVPNTIRNFASPCICPSSLRPKARAAQARRRASRRRRHDGA